MLRFPRSCPQAPRGSIGASYNPAPGSGQPPAVARCATGFTGPLTWIGSDPVRQRDGVARMTDPTGGPGGPWRDAIRAEMAPMLEELRRFVDRRITELSVEVHGAVQLVDYSEANLSGQIARIHEQIATLVAVPAA